MIMPNIQNEFVAKVGTPQDTIVVWTGAVFSIPDGWALCDGLDGRPNLLDQFIRGVNTDTTNPGITGGESIITLITSQLPSHNHSLTETLHFHQNVRGSSPTAGGGVFIGSGNLSSSVNTEITSLSLSSTTGSKGSGGSHDNIPPFFTVAFIIKL